MRKLGTILALLILVMACGQDRRVSIDSVSQKEFEKLNTTEIQLLDVRTPNEVNNGIIKGAKVVNFYDEDFAKQVGQIFDKQKPLYIYCNAGGRSIKASSQLVKAGFDEIHNLKGGYAEWIKNKKE